MEPQRWPDDRLKQVTFAVHQPATITKLVDKFQSAPVTSREYAALIIVNKTVEKKAPPKGGTAGLSVSEGTLCSGWYR